MYASVQPLDVEAAAPTEKSSRRRGVLVWGLAAAAWCVAGVVTSGLPGVKVVQTFRFPRATLGRAGRHETAFSGRP